MLTFRDRADGVGTTAKPIEGFCPLLPLVRGSTAARVPLPEVASKFLVQTPAGVLELKLITKDRSARR